MPTRESRRSAPSATSCSTAASAAHRARRTCFDSAPKQSFDAELEGVGLRPTRRRPRRQSRLRRICGSSAPAPPAPAATRTAMRGSFSREAQNALRSMRLAYLGTPEMAVPPLRALVDAGHDIALVVSRADARRGRGSATSPSPVKAAALELGLLVTDRVDD